MSAIREPQEASRKPDEPDEAEEPDEPRVARAVLSRAQVVDAVARVVARRGAGGIRWSTIVGETGNPNALQAFGWFEDMPALVDECYSRTAQGLEESLLRAETAPGTGLDKVAAFLVAAFETRRERGSLLSFQPSEGLPEAQQKRLRERDMMIRTRLKRLLMKGQRDGSLALRNADPACALILACLQAPAVTEKGPEQQMWDAELVELLLAAIAEPHPLETTATREAAVQRPELLGSLGATLGNAPAGGATGGATFNSSTSNLNSDPGGMGAPRGGLSP
jgi:hypothetical protein